ncbi:hypothetical protein Droror1_Dr00000054, partial [Drosera rotundifolia]
LWSSSFSSPPTFSSLPYQHRQRHHFSHLDDDVDSDGNSPFTTSEKAMGGKGKGIGAREMRRRTVRRFVEDLGEGNEEEREGVEMVIRNMYFPDLRVGWGVHVVQEVKVLARKVDQEGLDQEIEELVGLRM